MVAAIASVVYVHRGLTQVNQYVAGTDSLVEPVEHVASPRDELTIAARDDFECPRW